MKCKVFLKANGNSIRLNISDVNVDQFQQVKSELDRAKKPITVLVEVKGCDDCPMPAQAAIWGLCRDIQQAGHKLRLCIDDAEMEDPIDAVVNRLVGHQDTRLHERRLTAAVTCVAAYCTDIGIEAAAGRLVDRLKTLGTRIRLDRILKLIRGTTDPKLSAAMLTPTQAAAAFLESFSAGGGDLEAKDQCIYYYGGEFYLFDQNRWRELPAKEVYARLARFLQQQASFRSLTRTFVADATVNLAGSCLVATAEPLPFWVDSCGPPVQMRRMQIVCFRNGLLDLETIVAGQPGELMPFDSRWFSVVQLPFDFDPAALCPDWLLFLYQVLEIDPTNDSPFRMGDQRLQVLQELFGYCLLSDGRLQKFFIFFGEGANGKSVIQHILTCMLGATQVSHVSLDQFHGTFGLEPLLGKTANICGDLNEIDVVAEGILKRLTGKDIVEVCRKNRESQPMAPAVKLIFATNTLPRFADKTKGIWHRLIAMPFFKSIPQEAQNALLAEQLEAELPGILNWAILGLQRLNNQKGFSNCALCHNALLQHKLDCDPVTQFIAERIERHPAAVVNLCELYNEYRDWCLESGRKQLSKNELSRQVTRLPNVSKHRCTQADRASGLRDYYFRGLTLAAEPTKLYPPVEVPFPEALDRRPTYPDLPSPNLDASKHNGAQHLRRQTPDLRPRPRRQFGRR